MFARSLSQLQSLAAQLRSWVASSSPEDPIPEEVAADVQAHLSERRGELSYWLFLTRLLLSLSLALFLLVEMLVTAHTPLPYIGLLAGYAAANAAVHVLCKRTPQVLPWLYAGLDLTLALLLRHVTHFSAFADSNATLVGLLALVLLIYTLYGSPKLSAVLSLAALLAVTGTLYLAPEPDVPSASPLQPFLRIEYLSVACLVTCLLALRLRKRMTDRYVELYQRMYATVADTASQSQHDDREEVDRLKRDFIAVLSHELRNPLTPLSSALKIVQSEMQEGRHDPEMLGIAVESASRLQRLVHDYTELAELLARPHEEVPCWNVQIKPLMETLTERASPSRFVLEQLESLAAASDPHLLLGALRAVLRRAELRTPQDRSITICGSTEGDAIVVSVHDPTSFLSSEIVESLSDPFASSRERLFASGNTGIELILAQHALHRIGGRLRIDSARKKGTTVHCVLPGARPDHEWFDDRQLHSPLFKRQEV